MAPLFCASSPPVVVRLKPSDTEKTCIITITASMPISMPTITSTRLRPCWRRARAIAGDVEVIAASSVVELRHGHVLVRRVGSRLVRCLPLDGHRDQARVRDRDGGQGGAGHGQ